MSMTLEEMDTARARVNDFMRREWEALTPAREKMERTITAAKAEYNRAAAEYSLSMSCETCRHHKGHKSFEETCPRVNELLFRNGTKTAKQIMDDTKARGCFYHSPRGGP